MLKRPIPEEELAELKRLLCNHEGHLKPELKRKINFEQNRRAVKTFTINPSEDNYLIHFPSNTMFIFTNGSCHKEKVARAVYWGKSNRHNKAFAAAVVPRSTTTKLLAIDEALSLHPERYNLHIITDSKAAIATIKGFKNWSCCKQNNTIGQSMVLSIRNKIKDIKNTGHTVKITHIYSHINNKKKRARAEGPDELKRFQEKLKKIKHLLPSKLKQYKEGNEGVDRLAKLGLSQPPEPPPWNIPHGSPEVIVFDKEGREMDSSIRSIVMER